MASTIFCGLLVVVFSFKIEQISWFWTARPPVAIGLSLLTIALGTQCVKYHIRSKKQQ